jgi:ketosteroid isomerase-like protein
MNDEAMIRALVDSFAAGYSKKDVKAITLLWPSAPVDQLQSTFAMYESITLTLSLVSIKIDGDTATAVIGALTLSVDSDATTYRHERQSSWRFRKLAGGWIIVSQQ